VKRCYPCQPGNAPGAQCQRKRGDESSGHRGRGGAGAGHCGHTARGRPLPPAVRLTGTVRRRQLSYRLVTGCWARSRPGSAAEVSARYPAAMHSMLNAPHAHIDNQINVGFIPDIIDIRSATCLHPWPIRRGACATAKVAESPEQPSHPSSEDGSYPN
jgi:hypothetical protein